MELVQVYKDEKAPSIALLYCFIKQFGSEALLWDPQVIRNEVEHLNNIELSNLQSDKLNAAIEILTSNLFETDWHLFETTCHLFADVPVDSSIVSPLSVEEIIRGISEAYLIKHEDIEYSPDVNLYVGKIFYDFGFSSSPALFSSALLPKCNRVDDEEKNKALQELFDFRVTHILDYVEKIQT